MNAHLTAREMEDLAEEVPLGRIGLPSEVAEACVFLAESTYVTGEVLSVGGGFGK